MSRPHNWLSAQKRKSLRLPKGICVPLTETINILKVRLNGVWLVAFLVFVLSGFAACSSHHYFSINAEEITNPSIMYSDSTALTNPF